MKGLIGLFLVAVLAVPALAVPHGFRATPFRPNVGPVPRGVPARFFSPRFNAVHPNVGAAFAPGFGYNYGGVGRNFGIGYGVGRNFGFGRNFGVGYGGYGVPVNAGLAFAPNYGYGGYGVQQQAFAPVAYAPSYAPSAGCGSYFPNAGAAFAPTYGFGASYAPAAFAPTTGCNAYFGY